MKGPNEGNVRVSKI